MMDEKHKCPATTWDGMSRYACGKTAKHEHSGKFFCKTHHPPTQAAKRAQKDAVWREKFDRARSDS